MMLNEIKITDKVSIYITNIEYNKEQLIKEVKLNFDVNATSIRVASKETPGLQSNIIISGEEIDRINKYALTLLGSELKCNINKPLYHHSWSYKSDNTNIYESYHAHTSSPGTNINNMEWTYTFYVQMPDNLEGEDGYLLFKTKEGVEYKMLPNEGDLVFFPASLLHMPKNNNKSKLERIVLGGLFKSLNLNDKIIKEEKSLI